MPVMRKKANGRKIYWLLFWIIALIYIVGETTKGFMPESITYWLKIIGSYWLAAIVYFLILWLIFDVLHIVLANIKRLNKLLDAKFLKGPLAGSFIVLLVIVLLVYGTVNAQRPVITRYNLQIPKKESKLSSLHAVMVSDIHLGSVVGSKRLNKMVEMINSLNPDVVFIAGDVVDENIDEFDKQNMSEIFRKIKSKYGVFAVPGNHEHYSPDVDVTVSRLEEAGINVLRDEYVLVADSFYVIGREDRAVERFNGMSRKSIAELKSDFDKDLPIIMMDHQPYDLQEGRKNGVDLQLSGHTHKGQFFPIQFITQKVFEIDWGYLYKDGMHTIVSSGFGTWGPPIRIGNNPEIIDIHIKFE